MRLCVIIPYFGVVPSWWKFYVQGVRANPELDFLVFSDCIRPIKGLDNLKCHETTLDGIRRIASAALGVEVALYSARKLCDLKPLYGKIFSAVIKSYEFWGFGDIDVIYGSLRHFLSQAIPKADIISFRSPWISGSLTFCRNTLAINNLFEKCSNWTQVVSNPHCVAFDELGGQGHRQRLAGVPFEKLRGCQDSYSAVVNRAQANGQLCLYAVDAARESLGLRSALLWTPDGLFDLRTHKEWAYYHMVIDKRRFFHCSPNQKPSERFIISGTGFFTEKEYGLPHHWLVASQRIIKGLMFMAGRGCRRILKSLTHS